MFELDPAFLAGSRALCELPLSHVRLQGDGRFPWLLLIPRVAGAAELDDLSETDRQRLIEETVLAGRAARAMGEALGRPVEKLNVGALGNITRQLHIHVVGRRRDDPAWPGPVWGFGAVEPYDEDMLTRVRTAALALLSP